MRYPILLTRNLQTAKEWVRNISHGTERYGIIASSGAKRLRADGVTVPKDIEIEKWFLNGKDDVNSSYFMEVAASEFKIQGLEIDYAVVVWEADYRYLDGKFTYNNFAGSSWSKVNNPIAQNYQKNSYRVLLTRARQGYIIYVPKGSPEDVIAIEGQPKEQIYYHRSIQDIFNLCFRAGFVIDGFYEECFKTNKEIPMVMIVRLKKVKRDTLQ